MNSGSDGILVATGPIAPPQFVNHQYATVSKEEGALPRFLSSLPWESCQPKGQPRSLSKLEKKKGL